VEFAGRSEFLTGRACERVRLLASRFVVGPCLDRAASLDRLLGEQVNDPLRPLFDFRAPLKTRSDKPGRRPQPATPLMGSRSLQHSRIRRSTHTGVPPPANGPPSGFDYPLGGFRPPNPCRPCFVSAALMGFALRSLPLSRGIPAFPPRRTHIPFCRPISPARRPIGSEGRGSWVLPLARVPRVHRAGFARRRRLLPWAFSSSGFAREGLERDFARSPLVRFFSAGTNACSASAPEFRSAFAWPRPQAVEATLMGFCAGAIPLVRACQPLWLFCSPHAASCIAADRSAIFERPYGSTGAVRDAP